MKINIKIIYVLIFLLPISVISQTLQWAHSFGSTNQNLISTSVVFDNSNNIIFTGYFMGTIDFDSGTSTYNLTSAGSGRAMFLAKYDPLGNFLWALKVDMNGSSYRGFTACIDYQNNIILTGQFSGFSDFDAGSGIATINSQGSSDVILVKYDSVGNFVWGGTIGGAGAGGGGSDICIDKFGNYCVTGSVYGTVDFDLGSGNYLLTTPFYQGFIAKYDTSGSLLQVISITGNDNVGGLSISKDTISNSFIAGYFLGTADFDPSNSTYNLSANGSINDPYLAKYNTNGNLQWAFHLGMVSNIGNYLQCSATNDGDVYLAGSIFDSTDFDPGSNIAMLNTIGAEDVFFAKYDSAGNYLWVQSIGSPAAHCNIQDLQQDGQGNIILTGFFSGTADFNPGIGTYTLTATSTFDSFIAKYDSLGNFIFAFSFGNGLATSVAAKDDVFCITGNYQSSVNDFDPQALIYNLPLLGTGDIPLAQYSSSSLSIKNIESSNLLSVYPNPFATKTTIQINKPTKGNYSLTLYDLKGQVVRVINNINNNKVEIERENLIGGLYFFQLKTEGEIIGTGKLTIE